MGRVLYTPIYILHNTMIIQLLLSVATTTQNVKRDHKGLFNWVLGLGLGFLQRAYKRIQPLLVPAVPYLECFSCPCQGLACPHNRERSQAVLNMYLPCDLPLVSKECRTWILSNKLSISCFLQFQINTSVHVILTLHFSSLHFLHSCTLCSSELSVLTLT